MICRKLTVRIVSDCRPFVPAERTAPPTKWGRKLLICTHYVMTGSQKPENKTVVTDYHTTGHTGAHALSIPAAAPAQSVNAVYNTPSRPP